MTEQTEHRRALIEALRSGKYQQGHGALRKEIDNGSNDDVFCCLGVACDLYNPNLWETPTSRNGFYIYLNTESILPTEVQQYYGMTNIGGSGINFGYAIIENYDPGIYNLIDLNDSGLPFDQIADVIEYYFWDEDHS